MYSINILLQTLAVILLLPFTLSAPAPDSIFLLQSSTFKPLGCSTTFHPTSILRQVPSPFACFSRCSDKQVAAYSQLQSGVLCACGGEDMLEDVGQDRCRDNTWFLFQNSDLPISTSTNTAFATQETTKESVNKELQIQKRDRLMPFMMMKKKALAKRSMNNNQ